VAILPAGKRRNALTTAIEGLLDEDFRDRILTFDRDAARAYATIAAARRAAGRPISQFDCQIAAIARAHEATVATRNTSDYEGCGVNLLDPWTYGARQ
jgi:predicted nucleic acid-binding protein